MRNVILSIVLLGCASGTGESGNAGTPGYEPPPGTGGGGGSVDPPPLGPPIVVPPESYEHWVWVPVPQMHCADNSPAGFHVVHDVLHLRIGKVAESDQHDHQIGVVQGLEPGNVGVQIGLDRSIRGVD